MTELEKLDEDIAFMEVGAMVLATSPRGVLQLVKMNRIIERLKRLREKEAEQDETLRGI